MTIRKIATGFCFCMVNLSASAQGAFDFEDITDAINVDPVVAIDVSPLFVSLVRNFFLEADPATAKILEGLKSIAVRVYHTDDNSRRITSLIEDVTGDLERTGWQQVVMVQDEGVSVRIHIQSTAEEVSGLTLMLFDGTEAIFLNVDGSVSAADLGKVMAAFRSTGMMPTLPSIPMAPATGPVPQAGQNEGG